MNRIASAALTILILATSAEAIADEIVTETRPVDARVLKVIVDGVIDLKLKQGAVAALTISGEKRLVRQVVTSARGDTLDIDADRESRSVHFNRDDKQQLRAELTLPNLSEFTSRGVGSTDVAGFSGKEVKLGLEGAGVVTFNGRYRAVNARLGGVGSLTLNTGESELVDLRMSGAGQITVTGTSKLLRAKLGGIGGLDAEKLVADAVELNLTGLGGATVYAKESATLNLTGLGSATVYGKPAQRTSNARGMGSVAFK
jgi:hypothetical protein